MASWVIERRRVTMTPKVSVLIHNRNRASILASCLASVAALKHRPLEVIVLDAQSTDESPQVISRAIEAMRRRKIEARQLRCPVMGCPASRNLAAKNATGDFLVFIDNDATFEKDTDITPVLDWFRSDLGLAIVSFRISWRLRSVRPILLGVSPIAARMVSSPILYVHVCRNRILRSCGRLSRGRRVLGAAHLFPRRRRNELHFVGCALEFRLYARRHNSTLP